MAENEAREALDITVKGVVQGVGFRPFVFRCAQKFHLTGWVLNALDGVTIHVEGTQNDLDCFAIALVQEAPEAANVKELELNEAPVEGFEEFEIRFSDDSEANETTLVSPRSCHLRCLRGRTFRSRESPLSLSLHQLHELRSAFHHHR